jgi:hypothetical protein
MNKKRSYTMKKKGTALILTCAVTLTLGLLATGFLMRSIVEQRSTDTYAEDVRAFWVAEAGSSEAIVNLRNNPAWNPGSLSQGERQVGTDGEFAVSVVTPAGNPNTREVTITGTIAGYRNYQKRIFFTVDYTPVFHNEASVGDLLRGSGILFAMEIEGHTEVGTRAEKKDLFGGYVEDTSWITTHAGYDYDWHAEPDPRIIYPDGPTDVNSTPDEFADFKDYNQQAINNYDPSEVIYIQTNNDVVIWPGWNGQGKILVGGSVLTDGEGQPITLSGKKVLYVEGDNAGDGDVEIYFGAAEVFGDDEDLTIITTGAVTYVEPLQSPDSDGRLSTISWDDYEEAGILWTNHNLNAYSHDDVNFLSLANASQTEGVYIANDDMEMVAILAKKTLIFPENIIVPPGFEGFADISQGNIFSPGGAGMMSNDWQELEVSAPTS